MKKEITKDEIKKALLRHYNKKHDTTFSLRSLEEHNDRKNQFTLFVLTGTPAKGYGIYIPDKGILNLYDSDGKVFKVFSDTIIK